MKQVPFFGSVSSMTSFSSGMAIMKPSILLSHSAMTTLETTITTQTLNSRCSTQNLTWISWTLG